MRGADRGPRRVLLVGDFGGGNSGNDSSLEVFARAVCARLPDAKIVVLGRNPETITNRFGFEAHPLYDRPRTGRLGSLLGRLTDPVRYARIVRSCQAAVVPGMGAMEGTMGLHVFGMRYVILLISLTCRLLRVPFGLVGIGVSPADSVAARAVGRWAGRLATFRSYRDEFSRSSAIAFGLGRPSDQVYADSVFLEEAPVLPIPDGPDHVGLGVVTFFGSHPTTSSEVNDAANRRYVERMVRLGTALVNSGVDVTVLTGGASDIPVVLAVAAGIRAAQDDESRAGVTSFTGLDRHDLLELMSRLHLVAAAQYHSLVYSLMAGRPPVAMGYGQKAVEVATAAGFGRQAQLLDEFDVDRALADIKGLLNERAAAAERAQEACVRLRRLANGQVDAALSSLRLVTMGAH